MTEARPRHRQFSLLRVGGFVALFAIVLAVLLYFDREVYLAAQQYRDRERDWSRFLRIMGWAPTWLIAAAAMALVDTRYWPKLNWRSWTRSILLLIGMGGTAGLAELFKIIARRVRPGEVDGCTVVRPWLEDTFSSSGLAMPSSHTAVAFGACLMLCHIYPRASVVWIALALGCGATRVLAGAHFASDIFVAAALGWVVVRTTWYYHVQGRDEFAQIAPEAIP